ncbi:response regulator [Dyella sp. M7H15-1]|uniref:ATP-binding protein n=1 Tax=Dyella sp. M7H15-1 TaxID=2501295 RepID=UPI001004DE36|nr:ATP-binding protein [Dyella sp. M7H15-1]QAU23545.1 response regulator [Dyella sp. M7H15-1]
MDNEQSNAATKPQTTLARLREKLLDHTILLLALLVASITGAALWYLHSQQQRIVSSLAEQGAKQELTTMEQVRAMYTTEVVDKMRGHDITVTHDHLDQPNTIPLPATLTIELGNRINSQNTGLQLRLYSDYPFPWRKDGGPHDTFERDALVALRKNPNLQFIRLEDVNGKPMLRYAVADVMLPACVTCHNNTPASPKKNWKVGDVRGVLEARREISPLAMTIQTDQRRTFGLIGSMATLGLFGVGLAFVRQRRDAGNLRQVASRLSAMDAASPSGTFVTDVNGCCVHMNQEYRRITGHKGSGSVNTLWYASVHHEDRERVRKLWDEAIRNGYTFATDCRFVDDNGLHIWTSCKVAPMKDEHGLIGYAGTLEDISDRKKIEQMKNEFVSTVSHELRTPLTSIMGSLGLLAGGVSGELSDKAKTLVEIAHNNSERLVRLINDILDIEKIESGRMRFELVPAPLLPLVEQAIAANKAYAAQFDVTFSLDVQDPIACAKVDADRLIQVMTNLMGNAAKFAPAGTTVELCLTSHQDKLHFSVTDHGPGIPKDFRDKIFAKFSQADSSDTRQKGGTGLGLSISKAIIEAMNGDIGFETTEGQGTTFYFELPKWSESLEVRDPSAVEYKTLHRSKVLVVEDDHDVATLLVMMLERAGYEAVPAYDAASARRMLAEGCYSAMTLDLKLPDVDGRTFMKELHDDPATKNLAIIVVSGHLRRQVRQSNGNGNDLGVVDWIAKPINESNLLQAIKKTTRNQANGKTRVLHVEDDIDLRHIVSSLCEDVAEFDSASNFAEAADMLAKQRYGLIILDLELPDQSGWDLLPIIDKQVPHPSVLVFSGTELSHEESIRVTAALVKSHATNPELLDTVRHLTDSAGTNEA